MIVPSIFIADDYKRHMSINLDTGLWQCFKSGNKGNFIQVYAFLENITYNQAEGRLLFKELENPTSDFKLPEEAPITNKTAGMGLIEVTANSSFEESFFVQKALAFLLERNLLTENNKFYVSTKGRYAGRLLIPFEEEGDFYYFQARTLKNDTPKYLNPSEGWAKSSHILYPYDPAADHLVICEGPLDAISLQNQGVNATCTMGCSVSDQQIELIKEDFRGKLIIGYDNDDAGRRGVNRFDYLRRIKRMADLYICHPPSEVKDWNEAHIKDWDLAEFIASHTKKYDYDYLVDHLLTTL